MRRWPSSLAALVMLLPAAPCRPQSVARSYDADAVRAAAVKIRQLIEHPELRSREEGGSDLSESLGFIAESLRGVRDLSIVPDQVLDSIVALSGSGRLANDTLLRFGGRAVTPLVQFARIRRPAVQLYGRNGPMDALSEMLDSADVARTLSQRSRTEIGALAREVMADPNTNEWELASACRLAIATRDPDLRASASRRCH
jgi:hypothetical protein